MYFVRHTAAVDNVKHFQKRFPPKEFGSIERDSKNCQSEKRFCLKRFSDFVFQLRLFFLCVHEDPDFWHYLKNATTF